MLELRVDGKLKIKGGDLNGARAIIVADDAGTVSLGDGLAHFTYALRLQTRYLFTFEQEGYTTKQVLFDTHVPVVDLAMAPFEFPFQVMLERPPSGTPVEYAGPVGFVRFMPERQDFGYDTDYRLKDGQPLFDRVREFRIAEMNLRQPVATVNSSTHLPTPVEALPPSSPLPAHEAPPVALNTLAPVSALLATVIAPVAEPVRAPSPQPLAPRLPAPLPVPKAASTAVQKVRSAHVLAKPLASPRPLVIQAVTAATPERSAPVVSEDMREEELIIGQTRVTTVIHIQRYGEQLEFRRVAHRFGPVFFFKNGRSCTAREYELGTDRPGSSVAVSTVGDHQ